MSIIRITKQEDVELLVPTEWRASLKNLADFFTIKNPLTSETKISFGPIDKDTIKINRRNLKDYPDSIGQLTSKTWQTSIYTWTGSYWALLVDLINSKGETSDLVMHVKIREAGEHYIIEAGLIYVP